MPPTGRLLSLSHRARRAHPLRPVYSRMLRRLEQMDADAITRFQEARLRAMTRHAAARSPHYRDLFARNGIDPRSIRTLADLPQIPMLTRAELIADPHRFRTRPAQTMWVARSSGTSGTPVTVFRTPASTLFENVAISRQRGWFGLPPTARTVALRGVGAGRGAGTGRGDAIARIVPGARLLEVSSYHLTPHHLPEILRAIRAFRPDAVEGWPSSIALLAGLIDARGERLPVSAVCTSSEYAGDAQLRLIARVFGEPIIDHYGQTERAVMAGLCEMGGYHVFPGYGIVELIPVPGLPGRHEIVGTPLHNRGFPLLRYRTGDRVGPAPAESCPCGRPFPLLGALEGRVEDVFTAADGRPLPMPSLVLDRLTGLREVQIAQLAPGQFEVRLVPDVGYDAGAVRAELSSAVDRYFGRGQQVRLRECDRIPRSPQGKLRTAVIERAASAHDVPR